MYYNKFKFAVFQHYWWILIIFALFVFICLYCAEKKPQNITLGLTAPGGIFSLFFLIQKQKLEELALFKTLFTEFNERYDKYNEELNEIYASKNKNKLNEKEENLLNDYFNLCAEEYLFYKKGYIYPEVWQAWKNGMMYFLRNKNNEEIKKYWIKEKKTESYYGLNKELPDEKIEKFS